MNYFVKNSERNGTCYHEFYKGKWDEHSFWSCDSIYLHDNIFAECKILRRVIKNVLPDYDMYGVISINKLQWQSIGEEFQNVLSDTGCIDAMVFREADDWLAEVFDKDDEFTIIGI